MAEMIVTCPSGLKGRARNMKAKEVSAVAGFKKGKGLASPIDPVLKGCWLETLDPGPYTLKDGAPDWGKVVAADRFVALALIRQMTWGDYEWHIRCQDPECKRSKKPFIWSLDLSALNVKPLPAESVEKIRAGDNLFEIEVAGRKCTFRLQTGADETGAPDLEEVPAEERMLVAASFRFLSVEGVEKKDIPEWVGDLDLPDLVGLEEQFDAPDGGIQTRIGVSCPDCNLEFAEDIPFGDRAFLMPKKKRPIPTLGTTT